MAFNHLIQAQQEVEKYSLTRNGKCVEYAALANWKRSTLSVVLTFSYEVELLFNKIKQEICVDTHRC